MKQCTVFFLSDRTGITAETLGLSLISQFENIHFTQVTLPFVDSIEKAHEATNKINLAYARDGTKPIVFATIIDIRIQMILQTSHAFLIDFFKTFIPYLEEELKIPSANIIGRSHSARDSTAYNTRIEAVNYSLTYDDGAQVSGYQSADVILIGVSRCGKTPTSLYLAMQYGLRSANYPLTEEDLSLPELPKVLRPFHDKLFGLTIDPYRLHTIRTSRKPNSRYATLQQCKQEIKIVEALFQQEKIPYLSSTHLSIEELASKIIAMTGLERRFR